MTDWDVAIILLGEIPVLVPKAMKVGLNRFDLQPTKRDESGLHLDRPYLPLALLCWGPMDLTQVLCYGHGFGQVLFCHIDLCTEEF